MPSKLSLLTICFVLKLVALFNNAVILIMFPTKFALLHDIFYLSTVFHSSLVAIVGRRTIRYLPV